MKTRGTSKKFPKNIANRKARLKALEMALQHVKAIQNIYFT